MLARYSVPNRPIIGGTGGKEREARSQPEQRLARA